MFRKFLLTLVVIAFSQQALALKLTDSGGGLISPISINLLPDLAQLPPPSWSVTGLRASLLWGVNKAVYGLDLGVLGNITQENFVGTAVSGLFNVTEMKATIVGAQIAGLTNINTGKTTIAGVQASIFANINKAETTLTGIQLAIANLSASTNVYGIQVGAYNRAKKVVGLQLGLLNVTDSLKGIQIGLLNINYEAHPFKMFPIINIGF